MVCSLEKGLPRYCSVGAHAREHVLIAVCVLGHALPRGAEVHHVSGDGRDNRHQNLVVCDSHGYHYLLHQRTRALDKCGNANWLPCCYCLQYDAPERLYISPLKKGNRRTIRHTACSVAYQRRRRQLKRQERVA